MSGPTFVEGEDSLSASEMVDAILADDEVSTEAEAAMRTIAAAVDQAILDAAGGEPIDLHHSGEHSAFRQRAVFHMTDGLIAVFRPVKGLVDHLNSSVVEG